MAAYTTGANWSFPDDLPGGWVEVEKEEDATTQRHAEEETRHDSHQQQQRPPSPNQPNTHQQQHHGGRRRPHYPPRQCRICLDIVPPTFHPQDQTSLPTALQPPPRVTYESPPQEGGRLLRPCKCKGSQKYVHEECLSAWRLQDPLQKRNYWQCPTCSYKYRLQRLTWGSWISSTSAQVGLTVGIFLAAMFALGFVADPIINLYLDPVSTIAAGGKGRQGVWFCRGRRRGGRSILLRDWLRWGCWGLRSFC